MHPSPNLPCLHSVIIIPGSVPIYFGIYVDDFIYFSTDLEVENKFENYLRLLLNAEFIGLSQWFLGLKVKYKMEDNHLSIFLLQEAAVTELIHRAGLSNITTKTNSTSYRTGYPVDELMLFQTSPLRTRKDRRRLTILHMVT